MRNLSPSFLLRSLCAENAASLNMQVWTLATPRDLKSRTMFRNYFYAHASPKMRNNWTTLHSCKWTLSKWARIILKQLDWKQSSQLICFGDHKTLKLTKYAKSVETIARSLHLIVATSKLFNVILIIVCVHLDALFARKTKWWTKITNWPRNCDDFALVSFQLVDERNGRFSSLIHTWFHAPCKMQISSDVITKSLV